MFVPAHISVQQATLQVSVNSDSATFKFLLIVETSNMLVYMANAGFP
jgi:hypothetical protein